MIIVAGKQLIRFVYVTVLNIKTTNKKTQKNTLRKYSLFFANASKFRTNLYDSTAICWSDVKLQVAARRSHTCSQEHDFILSVFRHHSVHHNLGQGVVGSDACEDGAAGQRVDGAVHERVEPNEADHLVREVFGGLDPGVVGLAGTLGGEE